MKKTERDDMLLFSKERVTGPHRYRLYFTTVSSLKDETPRVFRLLVRTPFTFIKFKIGTVYSLVYRRLHIFDAKPLEEVELSEELFLRLLHTRDLKFMDKKTSARLRALDKALVSEDRYYSFSEMKQIVNYHPDFLTMVAVSAFCGVFFGLALLIPFGLYGCLLSLLTGGQLAAEGFSSQALAIPIMGIGALPITIYIMSVLYALSEFALLRIDFTKRNVLKRYALASGGIRKSFFFELSDIRYLKKFGIVSGIVLIISVIVSLVV